MARKERQSQSRGHFQGGSILGNRLNKTQADYQGVNKVSVAEDEKHSRENLGISNEEGHNPERNILGRVTG